MIWPFNRSRPTEVALGTGHAIIGHGVKDGRAFVFMRPQAVAGQIGATPADFDPANPFVRAVKGDVIIWVDGPTLGLTQALRVAEHAIEIGAARGAAR